MVYILVLTNHDEANAEACLGVDGERLSRLSQQILFGDSVGDDFTNTNSELVSLSDIIIMVYRLLAVVVCRHGRNAITIIRGEAKNESGPENQDWQVNQSMRREDLIRE